MRQRRNNIFSEERGAELLYGILTLISSEEGLRSHQVDARMRREFPPIGIELDPSSDRKDQYEHGLQRLTSDVSTAKSGLGAEGWIDKRTRIWRITDLGREAIARVTDPVQLFRLRDRLRDKS
ncbi:hypothetical protein Ssi02_37150 [Sinosporangium siamense]|uniref:Uncharacterized protein n=1 Tax=Sinosporangium siamense TaxID=1367973 RepID=A0A919VCU6_9ACTN|nr:hypothetical protein Ssi02_37150 [Sinosporangium siamense]